MRYRKFIYIILCVLQPFMAWSQTDLRFSDGSKSQITVSFAVHQNLIIIPVSINGSDQLNMVLDTGISSTIITELTGVDSLNLRYTREVTLSGLGSESPGQAYASSGNQIQMINPSNNLPILEGQNHECYVLTTDHFSLSKQMGAQVNGLIGADFFRDFIVEINYPAKRLTFHHPDHFKFKWRHRKHVPLDLTIVGKKAFIKASIIQNKVKTDLNLMVDTGASLPMWIAAHTNPSITIPEKTLPAMLGQGLNGTINGVNGRVSQFEMAGFKLDEPIVSFPDSASVTGLLENSGRNGSIGNDILRRFHVLFDYPNKTIWLRPNGDFKDPFSYNKSGMEIEKPYIDLALYAVFNVVEGSPADLAGIEAGDQLTMMNGRQTHKMNLDQINAILHGQEGNTVRIRYKRDGVSYKARLRLKKHL